MRMHVVVTHKEHPEYVWRFALMEEDATDAVLEYAGLPLTAAAGAMQQMDEWGSLTYEYEAVD